nr:putative reverse transcriptase domain-containing protein [Tanacetum cinerariifolium]
MGPFFDKGLRRSIENIVVFGGPFFEDLQWRLASLPFRFSGLGLYSAKVVASYTFMALRAQSWVLQDHILSDCDICGMDDDYVYALACLRGDLLLYPFDLAVKLIGIPPPLKPNQHCRDFLLAILIYWLDQHMSPVEYRTILKYRLMIPLFSVDVICFVCRKACLDSFGEHAVHCKNISGFKYRHDMVREVLFEICRRTRISAKKEAPVNFLTGPSNGRSTLRPADVLAALKAASCKVTKHEKACIENQHVFIPFAFDTFGFLASEAVELLN